MAICIGRVLFDLISKKKKKKYPSNTYCHQFFFVLKQCGLLYQKNGLLSTVLLQIIGQSPSYPTFQKKIKKK